MVALTDAEAKRKADEAEQQRLAAAKAGEERKATAAAEAEAKRKSEEAERQRQATALARQSNAALSYLDYDKAIAFASEAIQLDPNQAVAFRTRGFAYWRKGDNDRAIADYNELNPLDS